MTGRSLGVCFAHPDDEAYAVFGSVALHRDDPDLRVVALHATDGGAGQIAPGVEVGAEGLGSVRRAEDDRAWRAVGHSLDRHDWLGYPDGELADVPLGELVDQVASFLDQERPDVVATFGSDGVTGHPDHIAIGAATDAAFHRVRREGGPGLKRLLHGAIPRTWFERHQAYRTAHGFQTWQPELTYHLRPVPDSEIGVHVRIHTVADLVVAGLREHRSQRMVLMPTEVDEATFRQGLRHEWHTIAWPPRSSAAAVLDDIFDAIDDD
ncbi:PIG-L deacetylase family protein [Cellulomonas aerilata]|uniref:PIG-L domain-containing protein n=1 Tax=Cellulomonas aerilata TaxID=515326 RepID=A0A512DEA1_9CELL|nr:PIG-L family deacetylase [Cellulomonas aerilata]GEO34787.1 PIG-L domain-containing protein [Cellulomonas aerilata]